MILVLVLACFPQIDDRNFPPSMTIVSPEDGATFNEGEIVTIEATVSDESLLSGGVNLQWISDLDGVLQEQIPNPDGTIFLSSRTLSAGKHTTTIIASDIDGLAVKGTVSLDINAAPSVPYVQILPENPITSDDISVQVFGSIDPEGTPVEIEIVWYRDNIIFEDLDPNRPEVVSSEFLTKGDAWTVQVIATDGSAYSVPSMSSVIIGGTPPSIDEISILPEQPTTDDSIFCSAIVSDNDGDDIEVDYYWKRVSNGVYSENQYDGPNLQLNPSEFSPGEQLSCFVNAYDGDGSVDTNLIESSSSVTIANREPVISSVIISPSSSIRPGDTLLCSTLASDPDQQEISESYAWYRYDGVNSTLLSLNQQLELTTNNSEKGDTIRCSVTVQDESGSQTIDEASISVVNTPPVLQSVGITPLNPTNQDNIICNAYGTDLDQDTVMYEYIWMIDGVLQAETSSELSSGTDSGSLVECRVTISDVEDVGNTLSSSTTIQNSIPTVSNITLSPSVAFTDDIITANATIIDLDNDPLTYNYDWYVDGALVQSGVGTTLNGEQHFEKNQEILVVVTANDGVDNSLPNTSVPLFIQNTTPTTPEVVFATEYVSDVEDLVCEVTVLPMDDDDDVVNLQFNWTVNGSPWLNSTIDTNFPGDTIDSALITVGDEVSCSVTASDSTDQTTSVATDATVVNCPVQYEYLFNEDFSDLSNIQECWSLGFASSADAISLIPFYVRETSQTHQYDWLGDRLIDLTSIQNYYGNQQQGIMVSIEDGTHTNPRSIPGSFANWGWSVLHNPDVMKISVSPSQFLFIVWENPIDQICELEMDLLPVSYHARPGNLYETSTVINIFHNDQLLESHTIAGYNENLVSVNQTLNLNAGDVVQWVAEPGTTEAWDWVEFRGGLTCSY